MDRFPSLDFVVHREKSLEGFLFRRIKQLEEIHPGRVVLPWGRELELRDESMSSCDWAWFPSVRSDAALSTLRAAALGLSVIVPDVNPWADLLQEGVAGFTVPSDKSYNSLGAPQVYMKTEAVLEAFEKGPASSSPRYLPSLGMLEARNRAFVRFWCDVWGVEPPLEDR